MEYGDKVTTTDGGGGTVTTQHQPEPEQTESIEVSNIAVSNSNFAFNIHKVNAGAEITITADANVDDYDSWTLIVEKVVNATQVVDDVRFNAISVGGKLTGTGAFDAKGNYLLTAKRTNEGLDRLGVGIHLAFDTVEFNVV